MAAAWLCDCNSMNSSTVVSLALLSISMLSSSSMSIGNGLYGVTGNSRVKSLLIAGGTRCNQIRSRCAAVAAGVYFFAAFNGISVSFDLASANTLFTTTSIATSKLIPMSRSSCNILFNSILSFTNSAFLTVNALLAIHKSSNSFCRCAGLHSSSSNSSSTSSIATLLLCLVPRPAAGALLLNRLKRPAPLPLRLLLLLLDRFHKNDMV